MDVCMPFLRTLFPFLFKKQDGGAPGADGSGGLMSKLESQIADLAKNEIGQIEKLAENKIHQVEAVANDDLTKLQQRVGSSNSMLGKIENRALGYAAQGLKQGEAALDQKIAAAEKK